MVLFEFRSPFLPETSYILRCLREKGVTVESVEDNAFRVSFKVSKTSLRVPFVKEILFAQSEGHYILIHSFKEPIILACGENESHIKAFIFEEACLAVLSNVFDNYLVIRFGYSNTQLGYYLLTVINLLEPPIRRLNIPVVSLVEKSNDQFEYEEVARLIVKLLAPPVRTLFKVSNVRFTFQELVRYTLLGYDYSFRKTPDYMLIGKDHIVLIECKKRRMEKRKKEEIKEILEDFPKDKIMRSPLILERFPNLKIDLYLMRERGKGIINIPEDEENNVEVDVKIQVERIGSYP